MSYARIAVVGSAFFGLAIATLHVLQPDKDLRTEAISQYVHGPYGWLMGVAFLVGGIASFALAAALWQQRVSRAAPLFLFLAGCGSIVSATFPIDADGTPDTLIGAVHQVAGVCTFISLLVVAVISTRAFGKNPSWQSFQPVSFALTGLMLVGFVFVFATNIVDALDGLFGVAQRVFVGSAIAWQLLVAAQASRFHEHQGENVVAVEGAGVRPLA